MAEKRNEVVILASVPVCPHCSAGIRKMFYEKEVYYECVDCKSIFKIKAIGQAENELICQEVISVYEDSGT